MALLPIIEAPDPRLKRKADPVDVVTPEIVRLMDDMLETMYDAPGIGLAAPQVGVLKRVLVADPAPEGAPPAPVRLVNPTILWASDDLATYNEGCLSLPEQFADVERPAHIRVGYLDAAGTAQELEADGLLATVIQHEMDHLDGVLFVDHLSSLRRNMILRRLQKAQRLRKSA